MTKGAVLVWTEPSSPDREEEYNEWYDSTHAPDVVENVEGVTSFRRFKVAKAQLGDIPAPTRYLIIYELEIDDLSSVPRNFSQAYRDGLIPTTDVITAGPLVFLEERSGS